MNRSSASSSSLRADARGLAPFQRQALLVALCIAIITTFLFPRASLPWPNIAAFLPAYQTATISCYAVVAYLIYGYYRQTQQQALLYLWAGCVYTAAVLLIQFLCFPSAFIPNARILGGAQTSIWLWFCWHLGATGMLFGYAYSLWRHGNRLASRPMALFWRIAAGTTAAIVVSLLAVTVFHDYLPVADVGGNFEQITHTGYAPFIQIVILLALLLLWRATKFATPMNAWLGVAMVALVFDNAITMAGGSRLSVGWYIGRINALASALVMLVLYLKEVNRVYLSAAATAGDLAVANQRLASEHARLLQLFEQAPGFVAVLTGDEHRIQIVNAAFQRLVGERPLLGQGIRAALPELAGQGYFELLDAVRSHGRAHVGTGMKLRLQRQADKDHEELFIDVLFQPNGEVGAHGAGIFIQGNDVTEQHRAHLEVERQQLHLESLVRERTQKLEDTQTALMHAQKLEAIGKLTGGVAHDFNNVLHIISGNLDLIKMSTPGNALVHQRCDSAKTAIKRGAKLSSQLLSFARKQPLQPDAVSLPEIFAAIDLLLKRAVGERIEVRFDVVDGAWNVLADPQQLENVILNLALNASDAMPDGGSFVIEVRNAVRDGAEWVHLAFRDNGSGMSAAVRERAFEPFFSTKGVGKGTGLGLSMAHGFVLQSGGQIAIDSIEGAGSTIHIWLPRTGAAASLKKPAPALPARGGSETILAVDDEKEILDNVAAILRDFGYRVLTAASADEAAAMLDGHGVIDVLFTDVIMPGQLSATALAELARARHPGIRVLFTSGYTENAVIHNGRLDEGVNLLSKPYGRGELASAVRSLLAQAPARAAVV